MKSLSRITLIIGLACCLLLTACAAPAASAVPADTLYQVSTINSLSAGNYDGIKTVQEVEQKGDFGVGTFDGLNGEMVLLDGQIYQVDVSGKVNTPAASTKLPFAAVTFFKAGASKDISQVQNFAGLKTAIDPLIVKKDHFYAIRISGLFSTIQVRSESKQEKPYPILTDALKKQAVFNYQNVKGALVGFWTPDDSGTLNAVGYHLHFISDDHTQGGHVLDVSVNNATIKVDETRYLTVDFSDSAQ